MMTVKQLIEKLNNMTPEKHVKIGTIDMFCGDAERVVEHKDYVEIESDAHLM